MFNPLDHPILNVEPRRVAPSGWIGHIPFAMYLVEILEPGILVELGTYTGVSYCAFCQAVDLLELDTQCFAVDTWRGDTQSGFYGPEVLGDLRDHHDPLYSSFSRLLHSRFDDALQEFGEGTIDLLHIDGYHSYQAVRKDWENWLPKLSDKSIVLLHGTRVHEEGFGVWKLWEELKERYPHFELPHEHGLGLLAVGECYPPALDDLISPSDHTKGRIQGYFEHLGNRFSLDLQLSNLEQVITEKEQEFQDLLDMLAGQEHHLEVLLSGMDEGDLIHGLSLQGQRKEKLIQNLESELLEIKSSRAWRLTRLLWQLRLRLIPPKSTREKIAKGLINFFRGERKNISIRPSIPQRDDIQVLGRAVDRVDASALQGEWNRREQALTWSDDYLELQGRIAEKKSLIRSQLNVDQPSLLSFEVDQLQQIAENLEFPETNSPQVSIVIPVWNQIKLTLECLVSIQDCTKDISYELIIIDDGSEDQTPELLQGINNLKYVRNQERLGYLLSCNKASKQAQGDYLLFLNNDVQVTENWLTNLIKPFITQDRVGAVGPKILFPDGVLQEAGAVVNPDGTTRLVGVFDDPGLPRYNYLRDVDYVSGVCLLLKREDYQDLEGFSEVFSPAYGEDVDLCLRLHELGKRILYQPKSVIIHHLSATVDTLGKKYKQRLAVEQAQKIMEKWGDEIEERGINRLIAFYLPQYHPIPENDLWWGKGFTDWDNVVKASPNYKGHHQPHLPADLGFYDLRVEEVLEEQAALAKRYGIHGFCFYSYWFGGKHLLDLPLRRIREGGRSPIPFCICWANENWTRTWDGHQDQILIAQKHGEGEAEDFIAHMAPYLRHPDYIRIDGRPLLLIYRVDLLPDPLETVNIWRSYCQKEAIGDPYLAYMGTFEQGVEPEMIPPSRFGFDAAVEFPPHPFDSKLIIPPGRECNPPFQGTVHDFRQTVLDYLTANSPGFTRFRGVMPAWDNTPRRQDQGTIYHGSSPGAYQAWLEAALEFTREQYIGEERLVFLNAWNEWAEGAYLEPDQRHGHGYLEATRNALDRVLLAGDEN